MVGDGMLFIDTRDSVFIECGWSYMIVQQLLIDLALLMQPEIFVNNRGERLYKTNFDYNSFRVFSNRKVSV